MNLKPVLLALYLTGQTLFSFGQLDTTNIRLPLNDKVKTEKFSMKKYMKTETIFQNSSKKDFREAKKNSEKKFRELKSRFQKKKNYTEKDARSFFNTFHEVYLSQDKYDRDDLYFFVNSLKKKIPNFDCLVSILGYDDAQKLNLPVNAILTPGHISLRWTFDDDTYINYDPAYDRFWTDEDYEIKENKPLTRDFYLTSLSNKELNSLIYSNLGVALVDIYNKPDVALLYAKKAMEIAPTPNAYFLKAKAYLKMGNHKSAIEAYSDMLEIDSVNTFAYEKRGLEYQILEKYKLAEKDLLKTIAMTDSLNYSYFEMLGRVYVDMNEDVKYDSVINFLDSQDQSFASYFENQLKAYHLQKNPNSSFKEIKD